MKRVKKVVTLSKTLDRIVENFDKLYALYAIADRQSSGRRKKDDVLRVYESNVYGVLPVGTQIGGRKVHV